MKHYYYITCPDIQEEDPFPHLMKDTNCPRCLQMAIIEYEAWYRIEPTESIAEFQHELNWVY